MGADGGASLVGLALVAAQVAELLDGAEEAAAEMSVCYSPYLVYSKPLRGSHFWPLPTWPPTCDSA